MDTKTESKLVSLVTELLSPRDHAVSGSVADLIRKRNAFQIICLFRFMEVDLQPKPESEFMSLVTQVIRLYRSIDLASHPDTLSKLIQYISQNENIPPYTSLVRPTLELEPEPELISLIYQLFSLVISMNSSKWEKLVSLCPQVQVTFKEGKIHAGEEALGRRSYSKWECLPLNWETFSLTGEGPTHFLCVHCNGENHQEYNKAPGEIKYVFHHKHSLQLVLLDFSGEKRPCNCCNEYLKNIFYYCSPCDFAINLTCAEKPPLSSIDCLRWHDHTLALFSRKDSLNCDACGSTQSSGFFYMCPPCDFVIHQSCLSLPCVIRISRHPHRISYTSYFRQGDWYCGVCRRKIDNRYGGYSCIKDRCSYAAHSKCATQSNVWDGQELEGVPEDGEEEEMEPPFVRISDGIIQHFSHQHHHLRLDKNMERDYDESKQCEACITPIYFGYFYSCMQCDFILHEKCANLSRKIYHPIHPHLLTLVGRYEGVLDFEKDRCSACYWFCKTGFFYECGKEGCDFKLDVSCATVSEPLVHKRHMHPLFLTSKPGEKRKCSNEEGHGFTYIGETFNCIECNFSLCFQCATLPQKVRYKYDKHMLTLFYGEKTSSTTSWCEACEGEIKLGKPFYMCDEYCCVTLHIECLLGFAIMDLYMKAGSSWSGIHIREKVAHVLPNDHHMTRPICSFCDQRCPHKIVFQCSGLIFCSRFCVYRAGF